MKERRMTPASATLRHVILRPLLEQGAACPLDVMFVLNSLSVGGSESKVVRLANRLRERGAEIGLAYLNGPHVLLRQIRPDIPVWHLDRRGKYSLSTLVALRHLVREQRPRNVVAVSLYPTLYVLGATRGMRRRPRAIGLINTTTFNPGQEWRGRVYRPVLRWLDWTVYGSEVQRRAWLSESAPAQRRSCVIYNGVDVRHFRAMHDAVALREQRRRLGIAERAVLVGTVGRLAPEKGQSSLIDALARARAAGADVHLLIVGDGPMRARLEQHAARRGVSAQVTFAGAVLDVRPLLAIMEVFVLPSRYVETFSNAALEAMAMGKPLILSEIGGAREMIDDGVEGYVVPIEDIERRLPELLLRLAQDRRLRERLGRAATRRARSAFSLEAMIDRYSELFGCPLYGRGA